jgi:cytochrome c
MKSIVVAAAVAAGLGFAGTASADEALAQKSGCLTCHSVDAKKVGPSFKSVAAKFKGQADAEKKLVDQLKSGKGHPAVKTSDADTATLVKWVLSL